jgi:plasmid rolling circle replication initiator protein Rep
VAEIDIKNALVPKELLAGVIKNIENNCVVVGYYEQFSKEDSWVQKDLLLRKKERLKDCNKIWQIDQYEIQKIKDFQRTNLCKDKFCSNCKKVKQASRMSKYIPALEPYNEQLHHMVLTLPNCNGQDLEKTIKKMAKCFKTLINYLVGYKQFRVEGIDFKKWGYQGAVRSLEVTFHGDSYHPHYHVGLVLDKPPGKKHIENTFSFDFRNGLPELKRLFSEEEILIQKMWYLLISGVRLTKKAIDAQALGYSCMINSFAPGDYAELFKYMTKTKNEKGQLLSYDNFKTLYNALYRVKQIQGYGCLYRIQDEGDTESFDAMYEVFMMGLRDRENPVMSWETPQDLLADTHYSLISRKAFFKYLRELYHDEQ